MVVRLSFHAHSRRYRRLKICPPLGDPQSVGSTHTHTHTHPNWHTPAHARAQTHTRRKETRGRGSMPFASQSTTPQPRTLVEWTQPGCEQDPHGAVRQTLERTVPAPRTGSPAASLGHPSRIHTEFDSKDSECSRRRSMGRARDRTEKRKTHNQKKTEPTALHEQQCRPGLARANIHSRRSEAPQGGEAGALWCARRLGRYVGLSRPTQFVVTHHGHSLFSHRRPT